MTGVVNRGASAQSGDILCILPIWNSLGSRDGNITFSQLN